MGNDERKRRSPAAAQPRARRSRARRAGELPRCWWQFGALPELAGVVRAGVLSAVGALLAFLTLHFTAQPTTLSWLSLATVIVAGLVGVGASIANVVYFARGRLRVEIHVQTRARHSIQPDPDALAAALARGRERLSRAARLLDPALREATFDSALDRLHRHARTPEEAHRLARRFSLGMLRAACCQWLPRLVHAALGGGVVGLGLMGGLKSLFDIQPHPLTVILTMVGTTILSVAVTVQETLRRSRK